MPPGASAKRRRATCRATAILKDEALLEIAAHPPTTPEALSEIRAIPTGYAHSRDGKAIVAAVKEGLEGKLPDRMPPPERPRMR